MPGIGLFEFRLDPQSVATLNVGAELTLEQFQEGQKVDVTGTTRGHGTTGTVKRYNFKMQPASHGNSLSHRRPGSIGQNQSPGRVFKGKKMSGRDGNSQRTIQNLSVIRVDIERQVLLIEGAIPGAPGSRVVVYPAVKKPMAVAVGGRT